MIPHFLPGVIAYIGYKARKASLPAWTFIAYLLILLYGFMRRPGVERGWWVCLLLGLALPYFRDFKNRLLVTTGHEIAQYSYGIYLLHPFAFYLGFDVLLGRPLWIRMLVAFGSLAAMAIPAYHLIEKPFIRVGARYAQRLQARYGTKYEHGLDLA